MIRPTVLHVTQPCEAGVARCVLDLVSDQVSRDWEVVVASPAHAEFVRRVVATGARHLPWAAKRSPGPTVVAETVRLHRIVNDVAPNIVHLHSSKAGLCGRLAVRGRRLTIFQPHSWSFAAWEGARGRAAVSWERLAERWTQVTICVSEGEQADGRGVGLEGPIQVVPNGVDVQRPAATCAERDEARRCLELADAPTVVCVGRLTRQKGQDILLEAWPRVRARLSSAQLVLVGDGEDRLFLEREAPTGVRLVGHREDVRSWIAAADLVAQPSRWEGMSFTILEAMAVGRSVVATDVGGAREVLLPRAGAVVPAEDAEALASAVVERLLDPNPTVAEGRIGRQRVEDMYDVRRQTADVAELYKFLTDP